MHSVAVALAVSAWRSPGRGRSWDVLAAVTRGEVAPEREIGRVPTLLQISDTAALVLLAVLEAAAIVAVVAMWRERRTSLTAKLIWTAIALLPVVGLVALLVWRDPPPPNGPTDRAPRWFGNGDL